MNTKESNSSWLVIVALTGLTLAAFGIFQMKLSSDPQAGWLPGWQEVRSFILPRRALAAVAANGFLYVIGGVDDAGNYVRETEFSPIETDGSPGPWRKTTALPDGRIYLAAVALNNHIYVIGGGQGKLGSDNFPVASVEKAVIQPDGSLGPWQQEIYMTTPRRGLKVVVNNDQIYAIGGYNGQFLKTTERTSVTPDGSLEGWQLEPSRSAVDRYIHSAALANGTIYLFGGHVQGGSGMSYGDVESSDITENGSLAPWRIEQTVLHTPRFIASGFAHNNFLYILGGHNGAQRLRSVEFAPIDAEGRIGRWLPAADLLHPRSAAAVTVTDEFIYVLGGMGEEGALNDVEMAQQRRNGQLGHR